MYVTSMLLSVLTSGSDILHMSQKGRLLYALQSSQRHRGASYVVHASHDKHSLLPPHLDDSVALPGVGLYDCVVELGARHPVPLEKDDEGVRRRHARAQLGQRKL